MTVSDYDALAELALQAHGAGNAARSLPFDTAMTKAAADAAMIAASEREVEAVEALTKELSQTMPGVAAKTGEAIELALTLHENLCDSMLEDIVRIAGAA